MALSAKLQIRQSQALVMTPQLLQSIRLLQYSHTELNAFVETQIERNPLLVVGPQGASEDGGAAQPSGEPAPPEGTGLAEKQVSPHAASLPSPSGPASRSGSGSGRQNPLDGDLGIENLADRRPSLHHHVLAEVSDIILEGTERKIGEALAEHLDESGYLRIDIEEVATSLGVSPSVVEAVLSRLQTEIAPAGLFARSLSECLGIQLKRQNRFDPVMARVLDNLDLLARRDFTALRRLTGEDEAGLMEILAEIRGLDPKPGHAFVHDNTETIVPDVFVTEGADGGWRVELNPDALPRVLVDNDYLAAVRDGVRTEADKAFIGECQQSANWLVRSLDQRAKTILKVASEIVRRQDGFLNRGVGGLKPMTLMSVAEAIGMHESTVSRVTSNKFMATPRGIYELKYFFSSAISATVGGDAHSAESVRHRIKQMIDAEDPKSILSDDTIVKILKDDGVDIARRTVAKYREAMKIGSSVQRRREKNVRL